jgi:cytochrome c peroxidase
MNKQITFLFIVLVIWACTRDELANPLDGELRNRLMQLAPDSQVSYFQLPSETDLGQIPQEPANPLTEEKIKLGQLLFYETGLANNPKYKESRGTYSCATCHVPSAGFMPGRVQGIADGGGGFGINGEGRITIEKYEEEELDAQGARPLSLLNVAYVTNTTWAGKFGAHDANEGTENLWGISDPLTEINHLGMQGIESQNMEGLDLHRMEVNEYVLDTLGYRAYFDVAFADFPQEERYSKLTTSFAISAYIRTLLPTQAPFQRWLRGDLTAMSDLEKLGATVFYGKAGCFRCHQGAALSSNEFHALGVEDLWENGGLKTNIEDKRNLGRGAFTEKKEDMYKFKVPQIYNMSDSPFYFHGSSKRSLRELVDYFNAAIPENTQVPEEQISPFFHPLFLSEGEIKALVAFLENGLKDPDLNRYVPEKVLSGNCFPNNDPLSQQDLNCQ